AFHRRNAERAELAPHGLSATATHDTKRGEGARARIAVLAEVPDEWAHAIAEWHELTAPHRVEVGGVEVPDANEEYLLYQTLLGTWPLGAAARAGDATAHTEYGARVQAYMEKALKEAKIHTSWVSPVEEFDRAVAGFVARILEPGPANRFLA